ncbi:hypothetical protein HDV05_001679 [Chytridiales sp. JEL 0842]|nr:hypothetical protein HDV05_001679 [Chytridiales sp. JEL 0842]
MAGGKKKKNKKKDPGHKERLEKKIAKKSDKKAKKSTKKKVADESDVEEDIDQILADFAASQKAAVAITEEVCSLPSRRAVGSFVANPVNLSELIMFGGEHYDGQKVYCYNDLYIYNIDKNEWRKISSPNSPQPRSSHQLILTPQGRGFLFGGEFVSPNQTTFFHYKDFWCLDLKTYAWEKLEVGKKPSPRSGHRMVLWKTLIVLFGGFYDAGQETKYLDDLWIFDTAECKWCAVEIPEPKPTKRSGFQMALCGDTVVLYGGYTKEVKKGQKGFQGVTHSDVWNLKMTYEFDKLRWEKRKRSGVPPTPRSGAAMVPFKGKAFMFGGVIDVKEDDETIESECTDEFFNLNVEQSRFYPVTFRTKGMANAEAQRVSPRFNSMLCVQRSNLYIYGGILEKGNKEFTFADFWTIDLDKLNGYKCIQADEEATAAWVGGDSDSEDDGEEDEEEDGNDSDDDDDDDDDDDNDGDDDDDEANDVGDEEDDGVEEDISEKSKKSSRKSKDKDDEMQPKVDALSPKTKSKSTKLKNAETSKKSSKNNSATDLNIGNSVSCISLGSPSSSRDILPDAEAQSSAAQIRTEESQPTGIDSSLRAYFARTSEYWLNQAFVALNSNDGETIDGASPRRADAKALRRAGFEMAEVKWNEALPRLEIEWATLRENEVKAEEAKRKQAEQGERRARRT